MTPDEASSVKDHIAICKQCHGLFSAVDSIHNELRSAPAFETIPQNESDAIVRDVCAKHLQHHTKERVFPSSFFQSPRIAFAGLALTAVIVGMYLLPLTHHAGRTLSVKQHPVNNEERLPAVSLIRDSTFSIGHNCVVRLKAGSDFSLTRASEKVVRMTLLKGSVFLSAKKGSYDTIGVTAGNSVVYATGTRFMVERRDSLLNVAVLEGTVRVATSAYEYPVEEHEIVTVADNTHTPALRGLQSEDLIGLSEAFDGLTLSPEVRAGEQPHETGPLLPKKQSNFDSAAIFEFRAAKKFADQGNVFAAAGIFEHYLKIHRYQADSAWFELAYCYTVLHRFTDAITAYRNAATTGGNGPLIETALHRINKLLYVKLGNYDEARKGITDYLLKYPRGIWRDEELYLSIQITLFKGDITEADSLIHVYATEFPHNCRVKELSMKAQSLKR